MTFDGLGLLAVVALISLAFLAYSYVEWRGRDRKRRLERMVHRNLQRAGGWRT
jgi:peptidoglycan/LPS O-acetylase OafA/YrhL